jgi:pyruvate/2-oxoglutarate dehydrogenase complex dihydrolipoamide acyltransferase (E2) component
VTRLKPLPKFIIIAVILGSVGFGLKTFLDSRKAAAPPEATFTAPVTPAVQAPVAAPVAEAPVPTAPAAQPAPANQTDQALDAMIRQSGKK